MKWRNWDVEKDGKVLPADAATRNLKHDINGYVVSLEWLDESDEAFDEAARERGYRKLTLGEQFIEFGRELAQGKPPAILPPKQDGLTQITY